MLAGAEMAERHGRILGELSELGASLARKVHAQAREYKTPEETASLTAAFHCISRSVRQTLALERRLERELERADREARTEARQEAERAVARRKARVSAGVGRVIWTEYEEEEAHWLTSELSHVLSAGALDEAFLTEPVEAQIARICRDLGVPYPPPQREGDREAVEGGSAQTGEPHLSGENRFNRSATASPEGEEIDLDASG